MQLTITYLSNLQGYFSGLVLTRHVSSKIHSARPTVSPVATIIFYLFVLLDLKSGDGRTDNMCKNNDHYRPGLWVGRVDQWKSQICIKLLV